MPQRSLRSRGFFRDPLSGPAGFWATLSHILRDIAQRPLTPGVLIRCAVLLGVLAVIVGIFGMHVMTASHATHAGAPHSASAPSATTPPAVIHSGTTHSSTTHLGTAHAGEVTHTGADAVVGPSAAAVCGETCPGTEEAGAACVPSASAGSLAVLVPPASASRNSMGGAAATVAAYSYLPPSHTPCELSISRT